MVKRIARVFPRRTSMTPTDDMAFTGMPTIDHLAMDIDEVHISVTFSWDLDKADRVADQSAGRIMKQAAKRLEELDQEQKWIPVTEQLPDRDGFFIVCTKHNFYKTTNIAKAYFKKHSGGFYGQGGLWSNATHWMPLPEPPKEVDHES